MKNITYILSLQTFILFNITCFSQTSVMTFNIRYDNQNDGENWWEYRKDEVIDLLNYYHPDIFGIQEAMPNQLKFLAENLESHNYIGHGRDGMHTDSEATPIFYNKFKFKLLESEIFWLSPTPKKVSKGWDSYLNRIVVFGVFRDKRTGDTLNILNTHFDHVGKLARIRSAELLIKFIKEKKLEHEKVILLGDLNCLPNEEPIRILSKKLDDSFNSAHHPNYGPTGTFNEFNIESIVTDRIDYIFTTNIKVQRYRSIDDRRKNKLYPSDHLPILIKI